jgi:hypothetical protein
MSATEVGSKLPWRAAFGLDVVVMPELKSFPPEQIEFPLSGGGVAGRTAFTLRS